MNNADRLALGRCPHDHTDDPLGGFVCDANRYLYGSTKMQCATVVIAPDRTVSSMLCNATGAALIIKTLLEESTKQERSTKCPACADAHDSMVQALAIINAAPVSC